MWWIGTVFGLGVPGLRTGVLRMLGARTRRGLDGGEGGAHRSLVEPRWRHARAEGANDVSGFAVCSLRLSVQKSRHRSGVTLLKLGFCVSGGWCSV